MFELTHFERVKAVKPHANVRRCHFLPICAIIDSKWALIQLVCSNFTV